MNQVYYLAMNGPYGDGGSAATPLDASSQVKLDAIWTEFMPVGSVSFIYAPGIYQTLGWQWQKRATVFSGNSHFGSGLGKTIIQLVGADNATTNGRIFNTENWISNWTCEGLTLDCNAQNQPKFLAGLGQVSAIAMPGADHVLIQDVEVIGFGTAQIGYECFPISIAAGTQSAPKVLDFVMINSCYFHAPATGNKDGCSVVVINDNPPGNVTCGNNCFVTNCVFMNCKGDFSYCHCTGAPRTTGNTAINSDCFWYAEPNRAQYPNFQALIDYNVVINGSALFYCNTHIRSGGGLMGGVKVGLNNMVATSSAPFPE